MSWLARGWQTRSQSSRATGCGGSACRWYGGARRGNVSSSRSTELLGPRHFGQGGGTPDQERKVSGAHSDVKREAGPPLAKKPKGKSDGKRGKSKGARYTVDQAGVQLCFSWNFGGGTCGELSPGSPCPKHHVSVRQALSEAVSHRLDWIKKRKELALRRGFSILVCARRRMFDFPAFFYGFGEIRAERGHFGSRSSARYQGQSHQPRHLPRWHRFACGRAFLFGFHGRFERPLRRFPLGFPCSSFSRARFLLGGRPLVRNRQHLRGCPSNSRVQQLEAEKGTVLATRSAAMVRAVQLKKRGLRCTATLENPADPGVDPYPSAWLLPALASIILEPDAVQQFTVFVVWFSSLEGALLGWFSSRSRNIGKEVLLEGSAGAPVYQSSHPSRGVVPSTALRRKCRSMVERHDKPRCKFITALDSNAYKAQHGPKVLQSNASVWLQSKSKREDKEAENDLHVAGLRGQSRLCTLVPGWESTGRRLHRHCVRQRHRCDQTHAFV